MDFAAPYKGNFIRSIQSLEKRINQDGHSLIYLLPKNAKALDWVIELQKEGRNIYFIDNSFFSKKIVYRNIKLIKDVIKKEQISVIHTHFVAYNYTLVLIKLFFARRKYIIGHFHNTFLPPYNFLRQIKIMAVRLTYDLIVGVSASVAESVIKAGIKARKVTSIPNAIDFTRLESYEQVKLAESIDQKVVLMFGWPFKRKGVDIALDAIRKLNEENNNIILAISLAGGNDLFEREVVNQLGEIPEWVKMLKPRDDVASYYNYADIFLSASREEGFSYALVEAAYCKPLLISSDIPAPVSLKIPHLFTYPVENVEELKSLLFSVLKMTNEKYKEIKVTQKKYVVETYELNNWTQRIVEYYQYWFLKMI